MDTMVIRLVPPGYGQRIPEPVRDGIRDGACMDKVYACGKDHREQIDRVVLLGARSACWVDGMQEFIFDQLANFPAVGWLSVEADCLLGYEGAMMLRTLRQFHEAYPERSVCLCVHEIGPTDGQILLCDLTGGAPCSTYM